MRSQFANLRTLTLPAGTISGTRIVLDGVNGVISFYDELDNLVGYLSPDVWYAGDGEGERTQIDPLGGLRIRNADNILTTIVDKLGVQLREPTSGELLATLTTSGLVILDSTNGQDIEITTSASGSAPAPRYVGRSQDLAGSDLLVTPIAVAFGSNDFVVRHAAAFAGSSIGAQTMTPPGGHTEKLDVNESTDDMSLGVSIATVSPVVSGASRTFTSSSTAFAMMTGTTCIIRGTPGGTTPSIRSQNDDFLFSLGTLSGLTLVGPATVVAGDTLLAFVTMGNDEGSVPIGWTTPEGWIFLGANFTILGSGVSMRTLACGVWYKIATAADVAAGTGVNYSITITTEGGRKKFHYAVLALKDVAVLGGGADIRVGGRSVPRGGITSIYDSASSAAVTAETVVLTTDAVTCFPDRAYQVTHSARISGTAGTDGLFNIKQDDATGTVISDGGRIRMNSAGLTQGACEDGIFTVNAVGDIVVALTLQNVAGGANTVQHRAPRYMHIEDVGAAADFPFAILLTP